MSAKLLLGKPIAEGIRDSLRRRIAASGKRPVLACVQAGENPGAQVYIAAQSKLAGSLGIEYRLHTLPGDAGEKSLTDFIRGLNADPSVDGIMIQLPLPKGMDCRAVIASVDPGKDIEGMHPANLGRLMFGRNGIMPCTAAAALELLDSTGIDPAGREAVIIGHSEIVGKPLSLLLLERLATVTVCHIGTYRAGRLEEHIRRADILVCAAGKAGLVKGEWVREGAAVIDVGINQLGGKITGDVEFETARERAAWITPVPGGIGPLTVTMLMRNLAGAAGI